MAQDASVKIKNEREFKQTITKDWPDFTRFAVANTASRTVFLGMEKSEDWIKRKWKIRNRYVVGTTPGRGALKFDRAIPHHDLNRINARWGSPDRTGRKDYSFMLDQEEGFENKGPVPTEAARTGKNQAKRLKRAFYLNQVQVMRESQLGPSKAITEQGRVRHMLHNAYREGYGRPGSNQFFYLEDDQYSPRWEAGFYQFSRNAPPSSEFNYPNIRRLYYQGDSAQKKRKAQWWMKESKNKISQAEIDRIYEIEFNKSFTRGITRRW